MKYSIFNSYKWNNNKRYLVRFLWIQGENGDKHCQIDFKTKKQAINYCYINNLNFNF